MAKIKYSITLRKTDKGWHWQAVPHGVNVPAPEFVHSGDTWTKWGAKVEAKNFVRNVAKLTRSRDMYPRESFDFEVTL